MRYDCNDQTIPHFEPYTWYTGIDKSENISRMYLQCENLKFRIWSRFFVSLSLSLPPSVSVSLCFFVVVCCCCFDRAVGAGSVVGPPGPVVPVRGKRRKKTPEEKKKIIIIIIDEEWSTPIFNFQNQRSSLFPSFRIYTYLSSQQPVELIYCYANRKRNPILQAIQTSPYIL